MRGGARRPVPRVRPPLRAAGGHADGVRPARRVLGARQAPRARGVPAGGRGVSSADGRGGAVARGAAAHAPTGCPPPPPTPCPAQLWLETNYWTAINQAVWWVHTLGYFGFLFAYSNTLPLSDDFYGVAEQASAMRAAGARRRCAVGRRAGCRGGLAVRWLAEPRSWRAPRRGPAAGGPARARAGTDPPRATTPPAPPPRGAFARALCRPCRTGRSG